MDVNEMIKFPLSSETCRHLTMPGGGFPSDSDPGVHTEGECLAGSSGRTLFPIPSPVCRHLHGGCRPRTTRLGVRRTGRARSSWPVRWGKTWMNGCADFPGPRQGAADEVMVARYPFLGSPVVTAGGTIGTINAGNCPEQSVRVYRFSWRNDGLSCDYSGEMWLVCSPISNPVLLGLGEAHLFGASVHGFVQAKPANTEAELLDHPDGTPYAVAPDLQSVVFFEVEATGALLHWYRVDGQALRHDIHRYTFRPTMNWNSDRAVFAPPGGVMVPSASPAGWDVYFALEPPQGSNEKVCDLLYANLRPDHGRGTMAIVQRAIRRVDRSPDPLANLHLLADPREGVSVWESGIPPVVLPNGCVAVLHGRTLRISSCRPGTPHVDHSIELPGEPRGVVAGMVGDAEGWIYVAAGSTVAAIDPTPRIAWTTDFGTQITGEPVPVAPGVIVVTAGRRLLWIA